MILEPHETDDIAISIEAHLTARYLGKIIPNEGQCLKLQSIKLGDAIVIGGSGSLQVECTFFCLVAKPLAGEVLVGTVQDQSEEGLVVTCGDGLDL